MALISQRLFVRHGNFQFYSPNMSKMNKKLFQCVAVGTTVGKTVDFKDVKLYKRIVS